jgi:dipeptidyl aminopeptidase/acylaminoacyl peptidase
MPRRTAVLAVLVVAGLAPAQAPLRDVTPDDYFSLAAVTDFAVSPDGKHVAYCDSRWDRAEDNRRADLWVVATDGRSKPRRLTADRANDRHPRWAADGKSVYVLANRKRQAETKPPHDGTAQVWRVPLDGGDPQPVTRVGGGVAGFDYAPKADLLFYAADAKATDDDPFTALRQKFDKVEYGHGKRTVSEVHRVDLQSWRTEKVVDDKRYVRELAVTPDGKRVGMITAPDDTVITSEGRSRVDVWDADTGKVTPTDQGWQKTAASPYPWLENLAWSPDGAKLAYCTVFDAYPAEVIIAEAKGGAWPARRMKRYKGIHVRGYGSPLKWSADGKLFCIAEALGRTAVLPEEGMVPKEGTDELLFGPGDRVVSGFDIAPDGSVGVLLFGTNSSFPELYAAEWKARGKEQKLTDLNPQTKTWKLPTVKHIRWTTPDGARVGGVLEIPHGYPGGKPLPLVVAIHGGPTTSTKAEMAFDPHNGRLYFAARGYAVLLPNYRGSTGNGDKFTTDLIGRENDLDVKDILAGIKHLVDDGTADPDRVAVMGWSNGGYLTNCLISLKDPPVKFKAASSGAGIADAVAQWGFNDEPAYMMVLKKGLPWEVPDAYRSASPAYGLGNVTTPTLIHVGGNDERCPPGHSRMLYRALKEYNKVPAELVVYTGEPHGLTKLSNRKAKMEWDLAWFEQYLKK